MATTLPPPGLVLAWCCQARGFVCPSTRGSTSTAQAPRPVRTPGPQPLYAPWPLAPGPQPKGHAAHLPLSMQKTTRPKWPKATTGSTKKCPHSHAFSPATLARMAGPGQLSFAAFCRAPQSEHQLFSCLASLLRKAWYSKYGHPLSKNRPSSPIFCAGSAHECVYSQPVATNCRWHRPKCTRTGPAGRLRRLRHIAEPPCRRLWCCWRFPGAGFCRCFCWGWGRRRGLCRCFRWCWDRRWGLCRCFGQSLPGKRPKPPPDPPHVLGWRQHLARVRGPQVQLAGLVVGRQDCWGVLGVGLQRREEDLFPLHPQDLRSENRTVSEAEVRHRPLHSPFPLLVVRHHRRRRANKHPLHPTGLAVAASRQVDGPVRAVSQQQAAVQVPRVVLPLLGDRLHHEQTALPTGLVPLCGAGLVLAWCCQGQCLLQQSLRRVGRKVALVAGVQGDLDPSAAPCAHCGMGQCVGQMLVRAVHQMCQVPSKGLPDLPGLDLRDVLAVELFRCGAAIPRLDNGADVGADTASVVQDSPLFLWESKIALVGEAVRVLQVPHQRLPVQCPGEIPRVVDLVQAEAVDLQPAPHRRQPLLQLLHWQLRDVELGHKVRFWLLPWKDPLPLPPCPAPLARLDGTNGGQNPPCCAAIRHRVDNGDVQVPVADLSRRNGKLRHHPPGRTLLASGARRPTPTDPHHLAGRQRAVGIEIVDKGRQLLQGLEVRLPLVPLQIVHPRNVRDKIALPDVLLQNVLGHRLLASKAHALQCRPPRLHRRTYIYIYIAPKKFSKIFRQKLQRLPPGRRRKHRMASCGARNFPSSRPQETCSNPCAHCVGKGTSP